MGKLKSLVSSKREIIMYVIFGVLTTLVSLLSYFAILFGGLYLFSIEETDLGYTAVYTVAKVVSWILSVTFAFFTNKKYVFEDKTEGGSAVTKQYILFAGSRLATFVLDFVLNYALIWLFALMNLTFLDGFFGFSLAEINNIAATLITQAAVLVGNYFISKLLVFKKKEE